jgi:hypothetical protein
MSTMQPDELYGLALDRFIPERGALAKALRAAQRRDEAARVAALRKPSVAAWAVNQLVRTQGDGVRELFDAGDGLREAQADLLAGHGDGRRLRAANERERDAVDTLVEAARGLLSSDGHELSPAVVERVAGTLHAAALDAGAREQVRDGRLERELRHAGLGLGESPGPAPAPATSKATAQPQKPAAPAPSAKPAAPPPPDAGLSREAAAEARRAAREQAKREKAEREQAERERTAARKAARTAEAAARRRAERAGHALKAAEERRARAAHALEQADAALAAAQAEAQEAVDAQRAAQAEHEQLS